MEGTADLELPHIGTTRGGGAESVDPAEGSFSPIVMELPRPGVQHSFEPRLDAGAAELMDELEMPDLDADEDNSDPIGISPLGDVPPPAKLRVRVVPAAQAQHDEPDVVVAPQARPVADTPAPLAPSGAALVTDALFARRYRLVEEQAARGACRTFLAVQEPMVRRVVLGVLQDLGGGERQQEVEARFLRDAALLARRGHPNLAALHDFGRAPDGRCFLVGELLYGFTLREVLDRGPLPERRVATVFLDLCRGLSACHEVGLVHRGVFAENVTLEGGAGLAPTDNLARLGLAGLGVVPGSLGEGAVPPAGAPELLQEREPGPPADIYALGLMLGEALVGAAEPGALETLQRSGGRRGAMAALALRCLRDDPTARPAVGELIQAFTEQVGGTARVRALPAPLGWGRLFAAAIAGALLPTLLLAGGGAWWLTRPAPEPAPPPAPAVTAPLAEVIQAAPPSTAVEPTAAPSEEDGLAQTEPEPEVAEEEAPAPDPEPAPAPRRRPVRSEPVRPVAVAAPTPELSAPAQPDPEPVAASEIEIAPAFAPRPVVIATAPAPSEQAAPEPPPPPPHPASAALSGLWLGSASGRDLALDLKVAPDGLISGSARLRRGADVESGQVRGRVSDVDGAWLVELQLVQDGEATSYSGRLEEDGIQGRITQGGRSRGRWRVAR